MKAFLDLYLSPADGFAVLLVKRQFWVPFVLLLSLNGTIAAVWLHNVDRKEFVRAQLEEFGVWEKLPPERRADALDTSGFDRRAWTGVLLGGSVFVLAVAGVYFFIFRFFMASELDFRQSLTIATSSFLAVGFVRGPLTLLTLALKGDWNLSPEVALQASLAALLDRTAVSRPLWALAESLDLFSFWTLFLLASGYRAAGRHGLGAALTAVAIPWAIVVLLKVGFFAIF